MKESTIKDESAKIRNYINDALEKNDLESICFADSEGLIEKLDKEDALYIIKHEINLFEKIFIGCLTIRKYDYLLECFDYTFDFFEKLSPDYVREKVINAFFRAKSSFEDKNNYYNLSLWFFDYFLPKYEGSFSTALKNFVIDILNQKNKDRLIEFIEEYLLKKINKEDFIEILKKPKIIILIFFFQFLRALRVHGMEKNMI